MAILLLGCSNQKSKQYKGENLCRLIKQMNEDDQKYRGLPVARDPFFEILDSIKRARGISDDEYANFTKEKQLEYGKIAQAIADKIKRPEKFLDSLNKLQKKLDRKNTELLIDIIKTVGYPRKEIMPCDIYPDFVFFHAPEKYWSEIRPLIINAYKKGWLNDINFAMMIRQINGRKSNDLNAIIERVKKEEHIK